MAAKADFEPGVLVTTGRIIAVSPKALYINAFC
jgi:hypothetical protein